MLIGGLNDEEDTNDDIFNTFMEDAEILDRKEITVDGKPGLLANIAGDVDGQQVVGKVVVVAVTPTQLFPKFASAPKERRGEIESSFEAVLTSVNFFEPTEVSLTDSIEEADPVDEENNFQGIPSFGDFPTEASQLPPGGFAFYLASDEGFPTIIIGSHKHYRSTSEDRVIDLVSDDQKITLTMYLPENIGVEISMLDQFDPSASSHAPGAAVSVGVSQYTNTDGMIMIDTVTDNSVTGMVEFTAIDQEGNKVAVTGIFNELLLTNE